MTTSVILLLLAANMAMALPPPPSPAPEIIPIPDLGLVRPTLEPEIIPIPDLGLVRPTLEPEIIPITECGANEEYIDDGHCPPSCIKGQSSPGPCFMGGCFCVEGYISSGDSCIPEEDCKPGPDTCGEEEWSECAPVLPESCTWGMYQPELKLYSDEEADLPQCEGGCVCPEGTIRDASNFPGKCIPLSDCPSLCLTPDGKKHGTGDKWTDGTDATCWCLGGKVSCGVATTHKFAPGVKMPEDEEFPTVG